MSVLANTSHQDKSESEAMDNTLMQIVSFKLGEEEFGINILKVQEINRIVDITHLPNSPDFVEGVINLRGSVIPVISLRKRFNMSKVDINMNTRIVVVEITGRIFGFIVDAVSEVLRIPAGSIEPPPMMVSGIDSTYILGVAKWQDRLLIIMDLDKVLTTEEISQINS